MSSAPYAVAAWLFLVGLYGVVSSRNLISTILSLTVVQSATYLVPRRRKRLRIRP